MRRKLTFCLMAFVALVWTARLVIADTVGAASEGGGAGGGVAAHGLDPFILIDVALILLVAKVGGELFERFGQPAVLGELIGGIAIGNLALFGITALESLTTYAIIDALAELGVIILLFEVGLESNLSEMLEVGWSSLLVAIAGVVAPFFLGWGVAAYFLPDHPTLEHIFIGATLCATSVGITARVLKDTGKIKTRESRIILGAAVIDDVLGLLLLAVVAGAIRAAATGAELSALDVGGIALKSVIFLVGAILVGKYLVPYLFRGAGRFRTRGVLLALSLAFCFALAWAAAIVGLAPIVGAFAAGLVLEEAHFEPFRRTEEQGLPQSLRPIGALLVPIFFVLMGMRVNLGIFQLQMVGFAATLTFAAIIGKQVCSLAVLERDVNRFAIGLGMIPRGEVGLIFAGIGATLMLPNEFGVMERVISEGTFGVIVIMVIITTLVTPPALKWSLSRTPPVPDAPADEAFEEVADDAIERTAR